VKSFYEVRKKFKEEGKEEEKEELRVFVSHISLHSHHPIFCKFNIDAIKVILLHSSIVHLKKG
jgi:hypothetical protein